MIFVTSVEFFAARVIVYGFLPPPHTRRPSLSQVVIDDFVIFAVKVIFTEGADGRQLESPSDSVSVH